MCLMGTLQEFHLCETLMRHSVYPRQKKVWCAPIRHTDIASFIQNSKNIPKFRNLPSSQGRNMCLMGAAQLFFFASRRSLIDGAYYVSKSFSYDQNWKKSIFSLFYPGFLKSVWLKIQGKYSGKI